MFRGVVSRETSARAGAEHSGLPGSDAHGVLVAALAGGCCGSEAATSAPTRANCDFSHTLLEELLRNPACPAALRELRRGLLESSHG